jgi:hypothetical protein
MADQSHTLNRFLASAAAALALLPLRAEALTFVIANGANQIYLRVGQTGAGTSRVDFTVPAANAGDGTPIVGVAPAAAGAAQVTAAGNAFPACAAGSVRIIARARSNTIGRTAFLRVNSSGNLTSGGNAIPFTEIGWLSADEIGNGVFSGSATQLLYSFTISQEVGWCLQYQFLNTGVYAPGTYNGTLVHNLSMP